MAIRLAGYMQSKCQPCNQRCHMQRQQHTVHRGWWHVLAAVSIRVLPKHRRSMLTTRKQRLDSSYTQRANYHCNPNTTSIGTTATAEPQPAAAATTEP